MSDLAALIIVGALVGRLLAAFVNHRESREREQRTRELEQVMPPYWSKSWPWNRSQ